MGREGRCRQISLVCVGSTHSVPATLGLPPTSRVHAFPIYTAQALRCSIWSGPCIACSSSFRVFHKSADSVGREFCAFPTGAAQASRGVMGALSPGAVRLLPSVVSASVSALVRCTLCLFWGADLWLRPSLRMSSRISRSLWLETGSMFAVWYMGCRSLGPSLPHSPPHCLLSPVGDGAVLAG